MAQSQLRPLTPPSSSAFFIHSSYYPFNPFSPLPLCCRGSIKRASTSTIRDTRTVPLSLQGSLVSLDGTSCTLRLARSLQQGCYLFQHHVHILPHVGTGH